MSAAVIVSKEALVSRRNSKVIALYLSVVFVMLAAIAVGVNRTNNFEAERAAAAQRDRDIWNDQGPRNAHKAAHFARYAFKPIPTLSSFDPGSIDYAGQAVWLVAHVQNPAEFRYAEGQGDLARFVTLSPAWVMQHIVPLVLILLLFGAYAGEREDGTLRQAMTHGAAPGVLFRGKLASASLSLLSLLLPISLFVLVAVFVFDKGASQSDLSLRLVGLFFTYGVYFAIYALLAIGVSALCSSRRTAAICLFVMWCMMTVLAPRFAADVAVTATPHPNGVDALKTIQDIRFGYMNNPEAQEQRKAEFLERYGVTKVEDAPVDFRSDFLLATEEYGNPLFDEYYAKIADRYHAQERSMQLLSVFSPTIPTINLSSGLAGADRYHHADFIAGAEENRRVTIRQLNEDLLYKGGKNAILYESDINLWRTIRDYPATMPSLGEFFPQYLKMFGILLLWAGAAFLFARWAAYRACNLEAVK